MTDSTNTDDTAWNFRTEQEEQASEEAFNQAVSIVLGGANIQMVLDSMNLPDHLKQKLLQRLQEAVQAKQMREMQMAKETREKSAEKSTGLGKLFSMSMLASVISKQTIDKVNKLFAQNPQIAKSVKEQGAALLRNGVEPDLNYKNGQSISAPVISVGLGQGKGTQR